MFELCYFFLLPNVLDEATNKQKVLEKFRFLFVNSLAFVLIHLLVLEKRQCKEEKNISQYNNTIIITLIRCPFATLLQLNKHTKNKKIIKKTHAIIRANREP